jgi:hypothetical protein
MLSRLKRFLGLNDAPEQDVRPIWLVDREGVVYLPERRAALRAKEA